MSVLSAMDISLKRFFKIIGGNDGGGGGGNQRVWRWGRKSKGNMWSAIPVALLCMLVIVDDR